MAYINLTLITKSDGKHWSSTCKQTGTVTYGSSVEEADQNLKTTLDIQFKLLHADKGLKAYIEAKSLKVKPNNEKFERRIEKLPEEGFISCFRLEVPERYFTESRQELSSPKSRN